MKHFLIYNFCTIQRQTAEQERNVNMIQENIEFILGRCVSKNRISDLFVVFDADAIIIIFRELR